MQTKKCTNINCPKSLYYFSKYSPLSCINFCMRLKQLSKHFFRSDWGISKTCILNSSTTSSGVEKRWPLILFFTYGNKKKLFGAKSGLYGWWLIKQMFWVLKNIVVWDDVWELLLSWWRMIRLRRLVLLISCKTTGKQMVVYHSELTILHCSSGTITTCPVFPKKQAMNCLEVLPEPATFAGFGSSGVSPIQSTGVYFQAHMRKFTIHHLSRCYRRVSKHRDRIWGSLDKLCRIHLTIKGSCNIDSH